MYRVQILRQETFIKLSIKKRVFINLVTGQLSGVLRLVGKSAAVDMRKPDSFLGGSVFRSAEASS